MHGQLTQQDNQPAVQGSLGSSAEQFVLALMAGECA
jgi:hypothetical protein